MVLVTTHIAKCQEGQRRTEEIFDFAGGLLYTGRLIDVGKYVTFDNVLEFYKNTYRTSIDTNPSSTVLNGDTHHGEKGVLFQRPIRPRSGDSHSNYCTLHPLFPQIMDLVKDQAILALASKMIYKTIGYLAKLSNKSKKRNRTGGCSGICRHSGVIFCCKEVN